VLRGVSTPPEWEVLSQENRVQESEISSPTSSRAEDQSFDEDEAMTIVDREDEIKLQLEELRNQLEESEKEKQSLEEQFRQQHSVVELLKEESKRVVACMEIEIKTLSEELHQATEVRTQLETERYHDAGLREELEAAKGQIDTLVPETESLKEQVRRLHELNELDGELREQSGCLKKEIQLLKDESRRLTTQHSQALATLGVHTLERGDTYAFVTKPDLVSDLEVVKMLQELNTEIFETAAYMADSFTYGRKAAMADEVRKADTRAIRMLGSTMALNLVSVRHDEDPLIIQIACQACMVECCRRIISSWGFDGSDVEDVLPDLYNKIRDAETHAMEVSGRWRALTRVLVRSMLNGQKGGDVTSRLIPLVFDSITDVLLVGGCQGTRTQILEKLMARFSERMTFISMMAIRLNEVIGEEITSCEMKAIAMPYGVPFSARTMDDGFDDGRWRGLAADSPQVLCTTELGLQKEIRGCENGKVVRQKVMLAKPQVALESVTHGMHMTH